MIISYCLNPNCSNPKNHPKLKICYSCGWNLILYNRYRVIKKIGQGGFGTTFMGVDLARKTNNLCVVKQLRPASDNPEAFNMALNLFKREAKTLEKIDHPQIPKLLNYFVDNQQFYLVQALVKGINLRLQVKQNGPFTEAATRKFLAEILPVIKYIHSKKVIHRDLKPANILRRQKDDKYILIDFGAVKDQVNTQLAKTFGQTALTKFAVGTMGFAPPEQMAMRPIYASDIYALGATCLYLLSGKSPKKMGRNADTGALIWETDIKVSSDFSQILTTMLEPNIRNRYKKAEEVMNALEIIPSLNDLNNDEIDTTVGSPNYNDNILSLPNSQIHRLPSSEITKLPNSQVSSSTFGTEKLQKAIQDRRNNAKKKNLPIKWSKNTFLTAYRNGKNDFSQQDLSKLIIGEIKLSEFTFRYSNLEKIILNNADLTNTNFYGANLEHANLKDSNLTKAYLSKSNLQNANLQNANLQNANLKNANLQNANFCGANLKGAEVNPRELDKTKTNWSTIYPDGKRKWWKVL